MGQLLAGGFHRCELLQELGRHAVHHVRRGFLGHNQLDVAAQQGDAEHRERAAIEHVVVGFDDVGPIARFGAKDAGLGGQDYVYGLHRRYASTSWVSSISLLSQSWHASL
ncbi:hypothetical protein D3C87_1826560 [compost metagenome]